MFKKTGWLLLLILLTACKEKPPQFNGYIDADLIYLSSLTSGRLEQLSVHRGQTIHKNQPLFHLEQEPESDQLEISQLNQTHLAAQRKEILNQIQYAQTQYKRTTQMKKDEVGSQQDLDIAKKDLAVLKNKLAALDAQIQSNEVNTAEKKWQISRKGAVAPDEGIIFDTYYTAAEYVQAGQPVVSLITPQHIKAVFFVSEPELSKIHLNSPVNLLGIGRGRVVYISNLAQYTPPIIYSREARHRLVFRVEAQLDNPQLTHLHLGQPVTLEVL